MPDSSDIAFRVVSEIGGIPAAEWDACAGPDNPFVSHAFLLALEESGSATADAGWLPQHLILEDGAGRAVGIVPAYLKSHSYGEYVFDHGWANALERAGGRYYPKLQVSVPFTPVTGPRLLIDPAADQSAVGITLIAALETLAEARGASSVHATFLDDADRARFDDADWLIRTGMQYHWHNHGYATFDDFLGALSSRKRKAIRKERQEVAAAGVELVTLTGDDLKAEHWDAFFRFYIANSQGKWGTPYLTNNFFHRIGRTMPDRVVLILARHQGEWVAGALNLLGADTLYGRNWGCAAEFPFLHFEACYYRAIDFAIAHGLKRVEAGAQGEHKIQRGYLPTETFSAHWIAHPGLRDAVRGFVEHECVAMQTQIAELNALSPFRQEPEKRSDEP